MRVFGFTFSLIAIFICLFISPVIIAAEPLHLEYKMLSEGNMQPSDWRIHLEFSRPVSILEISRKVNLQIDGKRTDLQIFNTLKLNAPETSTSLPPQRTSFVLGPLADPPASASYFFKVDDSIEDSKGKLTSGLELNFLTCPAVVLLQAEPFNKGYNNKGVTISLSGNVKDYYLHRHIRITPAIGYFTVQKMYYSDSRIYKYEISGDFKAGEKYQIRLVGGQVAEENRVFSDSQKEFVAVGPLPQMRFAADKSIVELKSRQLVPLNFTNIGNFKAQLLRLPHCLVPEFDSLIVFSKADESNLRDAANTYFSSSEDKRMLEGMGMFDNLMLRSVNRFKNLQKISQTTHIKDLKRFLVPDFSSDYKTFPGSENVDKEYVFSLPTDFRPEPEKGGAIIINLVESEVEKGRAAARLFQITDLSITYKFSSKELLLWVTSMETGCPVVDTSIMLVNSDNTNIFTGRTDKDGLLKITEGQTFEAIKYENNIPVETSEQIVINRLVGVCAATDSDSCFIKFNSSRFFSSEITQAAPDQIRDFGVHAHVFTERGVYRPGETLYYKVTARDYVEHEIVALSSATVRVVISDSRGETVYSKSSVLGDFGTTADEFTLPVFSRLGRYNLNVFLLGDFKDKISVNKESWDHLMNREKRTNQNNPDDSSNSKKEVEIANTGFQVQEFEPPRHNVTIKTFTEERLSRKVIGRNDKQKYLVAEIQSHYYAGGPLRHAKMQWTAHLIGSTHRESKYPLFQFGNNDDLKELIESGNSILTNDGSLTIALPLSNSVLSGLSDIEITATVLDVDSSAATEVIRYSYAPPYRVGISKLPQTPIQVQEAPFQVVVLDSESKRVEDGEIQFEIFSKRWFYTQKRGSDGAVFYQWSTGWTRSQSARQLIKEGKAHFDLMLPEGGDYMVRAIYKHENNSYESGYSFSVGYSYSTFEDYNREKRKRSKNEIMLLPDRSIVKPNETVGIRYSLPDQCRYALVSTETDEIISARVIKLDAAQGEFFETLSALHRPNAYVTFMAPTARDSFPDYLTHVDTDYPKMYFGYCNIKVRNNINGIKIEIEPDNPSELFASPGETQALNFSVIDDAGNAAHAEVAICVVDEAVLALTGFLTPNLSSLTDFWLPLSVFSGDLRVSLIAQDLYRLISTRPLTGGGMGSGKIASDLFAREVFCPVAFYSPDCITDENGKISISFKLPDSMTSYRVYAVAADKKAGFASNERQLRVSRDFYLETGLPRFLTSGDKARAHIMLHNKTAQAGKAGIEIVQATNINTSLVSNEASLKSYTNNSVMLNLEAGEPTTEATVILSADYLGMSDSIKCKLPVKPSSTILHRNIGGHFRNTHLIQPELPNYLKEQASSELSSTISARLTITSAPWARLVPALEWLLRYPYGCAEQVSSAIIPLSAMHSLIKAGFLPGISIERVDEYINKGIENLLSMQLSSGGFGYWRSNVHESWWATQYAIFALTAAKDAGFVFPQTHLEKGLKYISRELLANDNAEHFGEPIMALSLVNLVMNQALDAADYDFLKKNFANKGAEAESILLLAESSLSKAISNDLIKRAKQLKPAVSSMRRGWQSSTVRQNAFSLLAIIATKADKKLADDFAGVLLDSLGSSGRWNSTADTGIALVALQAYFREQYVEPQNNADIDLTVKTALGSKTLKMTELGVTLDISPQELLSENGIKLVFASDSMVNWCLEYSFPDEVERTESVHKGFTVSKNLENLNGKEEIKVGDLIKVTLEFHDEYSGYPDWASYDYLAIEDPVPAGFTVINSELKNDSLPSYISPDEEESYAISRNGAYVFYPDHLEIKNDRVLAFKNRFWSGNFRMIYYMRASCEGEFLMKPTQLTLMYDPEIMGMTAASKIEILGAD